MKRLETYIEELRKERDRYLDISEKSQHYNDDIVETRAWLLNRIIGDLKDIDIYLNEYLTDQGGK